MAGLTCIPANPCHEGETVCGDGGVTTCNDTQRVKANGTVCDDGSVCRDGACMVCASGTTCPVASKPCRIGTMVCTTGTSVCTESDNQIDGASCGAGNVCQAGVCTACAAGGTCTPTSACHKGALVCSGATSSCTDTAMNVVPGTSCGKDMVCDAAGSCASCVAGASCVVAGNPCRVGMTVCNTGAPVCLESGNAPNGTPCGTGNVCSGGACVACAPGLACVPTNPCHAGVSVCAPAVSCTDTAAAITNGTSCGTDKVCSSGICSACAAGKTCQPTDPCKAGMTSCATGVSACATSGNSPNGTPCGANMVCTNGACVACVAGASCPPTNPCHKGTLACDTGVAVCTDATMNQPDGMTCGSDLVCRAGMCVSCTAGTACQPPNACKTGTTSCATGSSICVESGNKAAGTMCGTGMVCNAGTCAACNNGGTCTPANACHNGTLSCATGMATCTDLGTSLADGSPCGTANLFCKTGTCASCTPGLTGCTTNPNPCKVGTTSCATGSSVCVDGANKAVGASCGTNMVCNAANACVPCTMGMSCAPPNSPCHLGTVACGTGAVVCTDTGMNAPDGMMCGASGQNLFCHTGTCAACVPNTTCQPLNPCKTGTTSCSTGVSACTESGNKPATTSCGAPQSCCGPPQCAAAVQTSASTCDGSGTCVTPAPMSCASGFCSGAGCLTCGTGLKVCNGICCAAGQDCCGGVCQSLNTPTNCGACGHNCTLLSNVKTGGATCSATGGCTVPAGTSGCNSGFANCATAANDTDGCETPTNTNNNCGGCGVVCSFPTGTANCSTGTCVTSCVAGSSHLCGTSCAPNNDTTRCALTSTTCTDCTQANATAACGSPCNNTCLGMTLSCLGTGGRPNCGSWNFETNGAQGWVAGSDSVGTMTIAVSTVRHVSGTRSLAVAFSQPLGNGRYRIQVSLCGGPGIDLSGKRLQAQIFVDVVDPANIQAAPFGYTVDAFGVDTVRDIDPGGAIPAGVWNTVTTFPLPVGTTSVINIGFEVTVRFGSGDPSTSGTIYFDDLSVL